MSRNITPRGLNPMGIAMTDTSVAHLAVKAYTKEVSTLRNQLKLPQTPPLAVPPPTVDDETGALLPSPLEILMLNISKAGQCKIPTSIQHVNHGERCGVSQDLAIDLIFGHMSTICRYGVVYASSNEELVK